MDKQELINSKSRLRPPTSAQIEKVVKKNKVTMAQFERFFSIPEGTLKQVKHGTKALPRKYWHLFPDKQPVKKRNKKQAVTSPVTKKVSSSTQSPLDILG